MRARESSRKGVVTARGIDIHNIALRLKRASSTIQEASLPPRDKALLIEFRDDCLSGVFRSGSNGEGARLREARVEKLIRHGKIISEVIRDHPEIERKGMEWLTQEAVTKVLQAIDSDPSRGEWSQHDYRVALRLIMKWLRRKYGYPEGYQKLVPDSAVSPVKSGPRKGESPVEHRERMLEKKVDLLNHCVLHGDYPWEVMHVKASKPKGLRSPEEIPTQEEMRFLKESASNHRDRAFFSIVEEVGPRIGGIGSRQLKHVIFDEKGALIVVSDKTTTRETVRVIDAAPDLKTWIDSHPWKRDQEAPLWVELDKKEPTPMDYYSFRAMIQRTRERHNHKADSSNGTLPRIDKKLTTHLFRYFAQVRDELEGVPRAVQCQQRGWSETSDQPARYARIAKKGRDDYLARKKGVVTEGEEKPLPKICPKCRRRNPHTAKLCLNCGSVVDIEAALELIDQSGEKGKTLEERIGGLEAKAARVTEWQRTGEALLMELSTRPGFAEAIKKAVAELPEHPRREKGAQKP